jgi:hypothetical protein
MGRFSSGKGMTLLRFWLMFLPVFQWVLWAVFIRNDEKADNLVTHCNY